MATMKDIAKRAGVSITTVSHVLNETRFVSENVQNRVLEAAKDLGYQPNVLARGLRRGKSHTLGLIVPDVTNPYFAEIARSVEDACAAQGYAVILCNSDGRRERQKNAVEVLASNRVGGLILVNVGMSRQEAAIFENLDIPLVMLDREIPGFPVDSIQVDNALGGRQATEHLLHLGHRRIACLGAPSQVSPSSDRVKGYGQALKNAGIEMDPDLIFRGDFTPEGGYRCAQRMMARKKNLPRRFSPATTSWLSEPSPPSVKIDSGFPKIFPWWASTTSGWPRISIPPSPRWPSPGRRWDTWR